MQAIATRSVALPAVRATSVRRSVAQRASRLVVRASEQQPEQQPAAVEETPSTFQFTSSNVSPPTAAAEPFSLLGQQQEAINGRAAMLGFLVAIATEVASGQSVWSQIAGKYVDRDLVERPLSFSVLFFGFVVVTTAIASFAPQVYKGESPASRSFGPFTPSAELSNGRAAMLGFLALLVVEFVRGNVALF